jgi:flagellar assembly protein FliH
VTSVTHAAAGHADRGRLDRPGIGVSVRRRPSDPSRPIDYAALSADAPSDMVDGADEYASGFETGYADGRRQAEAEAERAERERQIRVEQALAGIERSLAAARSSVEDRCTELEQSAPRFAFDVLKALLGRESTLIADPGREAIIRALALDDSDRPAAVRLHPSDAATLGDLADLDPSRAFTVIADASVEPGGALVDIGATTIDSQLSRALARVRAVLVGDPEPGDR